MGIVISRIYSARLARELTRTFELMHDRWKLNAVPDDRWNQVENAVPVMENHCSRPVMENAVPVIEIWESLFP